MLSLRYLVMDTTICGTTADTMEWVWTSAESQLDRYQEMALEQLRQGEALEASNIAASTRLAMLLVT